MGSITENVHGMRRVSSVLLAGAGAVCLALTLSACGGASANGSGTNEQSNDGGESTMVTETIIGNWTADERGNPHLEFADDGTVVGSDGCNGINTTYTVEGDRVILEQFVSTLKACQGVDDWLRGVHEVAVDGDALVVKNDAGTEIGQLQRATDATE